MIGQPSNRQFRMARAYMGWSQKDVAEHAGVDKSTISRVEKGGFWPISNDIINSIRNVYEERRLVFTSFDGIAKRPS